MGRNVEAISEFDTALKIDPAMAAAWYYKGMAHEALNQNAEALLNLDKCIRIKPIAEVLYAKGTILLKLDRSEDALTCFNEALKLNSNFTDLVVNTGVALSKLNRHKEADSYFERATRIDPTRMDTWYNRGLTLVHLRKYEESLYCFEIGIGRVSP